MKKFFFISSESSHDKSFSLDYFIILYSFNTPIYSLLLFCINKKKCRAYVVKKRKKISPQS
ncbi:hypothetical protein DERF_015006 [Dermatophagoides farinae]|uniref:Uncharacterized protein n=1 Tax=Dermatophagoides farinae TaxID=6954 RepID=A0A922HND4_DERFA|nr:hypothetical protein DERF_015006 [Dermatophagoides farinae]